MDKDFNEFWDAYQPDEEPEPYNWNGDPRIDAMMRTGTIVSAKYKGRWGMYSQEDVRDFGMETK